MDQASALGSYVGEAIAGIFGLLLLLALVFLFIRRNCTKKNPNISTHIEHDIPASSSDNTSTAPDKAWSNGDYILSGSMDTKEKAWAAEDYSIPKSSVVINFPNAAYANSTTEAASTSYYSQIVQPAPVYDLASQIEEKPKESEYSLPVFTPFGLVTTSTSVNTQPIYAGFEGFNTPTFLVSAEDDTDL